MLARKWYSTVISKSQTYVYWPNVAVVGSIVKLWIVHQLPSFACCLNSAPPSVIIASSYSIASKPEDVCFTCYIVQNIKMVYTNTS